MKKKETIRSLWTPTAGMLSGARRAAMLLLTTLLLTMTAQTAWAEDGDIYYEVRFWFESGATIQYQDLTIMECGRILYRFGKVGEKQEVTIIPPEGKEVSYASCSYIDESDKQHVDYMDEEGDNVWSFTVESIKQNNSIPLVIINISFMNVNSTEPQQPSTDNVLDGTEESLAPGTYFCKESITYNHSLELGTDVSIFIAQNATLTINSSDGSGLSAEGKNINIIGLDKETSLLNITSTGENSTAITAGGIILHNLTVNASSGATVIKASDNLTINSSTVTATTTGTSENDYGIYAGNGAINVNLGPTDFLLASSFNKVLTIPEGKELLAIGSDGSVSGIFKYGDTNLGIINGKTLRAANYCGSSNYNGKDLVWYLTTGSDAAKTLHIEKNPDPEISGSDLTIYNFENTFSSVKNSITQIVFSDDIVGIGASAFSGFNALEALTIGSGVTSIGASAFSDCELLTELTIPDNVTTIGVQAFFGCGFTELEISETVTTIGEQAFSGCEALASATIPNNDGIASNIFNECTNLTTLTISGSGSISDSNPAKGSLSGVITKLIIGDDIEGIGDNAFTGCSKLTDLTIGNNVTEIGSNAFSGCKLLNTLTIPNNVTTIGASAFSDCSALAILTLGSGVESIGASAFSGCKLLTELTIPDNVTTIGVQAFFGCGFTELEISETVTSIGEQAFSDCESLESAAIPNYEEIESSIFEGCTNLTTLTINGSGSISDSNPAKGSLSGVITTLIIGNDIEGIGERAFTGCSKLTGLTIGNNVTSIGESAFSGCGLTALTIPDKVTTIGASAFSGCSALATLTLGSGVRTIGASAFSDCGLTTLTFPDNVMSIGDYAFQNAFADNVCKVITMEGETPPTLGSGPFTDSQGNYIILVPEAAYSDYCYDNSWAQYKNGDWITPQTITIKTYGGWASYCHKYHIGYDVTTESASAKVVTGLGEAILVEDQTNILPYDPVLINYTGQDDGQVILTANVETPNLPFSTIPNNTTWGSYSTVSYDSNLGMVQAYSVETVTIQGNPDDEFYASGSDNNIYAISDLSDTQSYVLRNGNFVAVDKDGGIGAHRCWLNVKKSAANGARLLSINTGGESSEIETTYFTNPANSSGAWYGLDGRKLDKQPTKKGLYIYNGKKHVIK